ncbi:MAG TPA: tRNA pseudouridine(38-40) synthase TruA [Patescibacteria group bacterium]|nr:tRNA pseudouridine(38-40) synthase TruA [Patescibacteria group bacterium]
MGRFKIDIEYEGTRYSGWQAQKNARTVQGELIGAMRDVFNTDDFELYGSGRTDAGVHALNQVAHLDIRTQLAPHVIRLKVNDNLPADVSILNVEKAHPNFHARHDAIGRSYIYQISRRRTAFGKRFVWWIKDDLNFKKMQDCAEIFLGMQDFRSFTADDPDEKSMKVLLENFDVKEDGDLILIRIYGSHFLWKMVRQMVGVVAEVGRGKLSLKDVERFLKTESDIPAKLTAPPSGLFLERAYYRGDKKPSTLEPLLKIS